jgi:hypothetical protein
MPGAPLASAFVARRCGYRRCGYRRCGYKVETAGGTSRVREGRSAWTCIPRASFGHGSHSHLSYRYQMAPGINPCDCTVRPRSGKRWAWGRAGISELLGSTLPGNAPVASRAMFDPGGAACAASETVTASPPASANPRTRIFGPPPTHTPRRASITCRRQRFVPRRPRVCLRHLPLRPANSSGRSMPWFVSLFSARLMAFHADLARNAAWRGNCLDARERSSPKNDTR